MVVVGTSNGQGENEGSAQTTGAATGASPTNTAASNAGNSEQTSGTSTAASSSTSAASNTGKLSSGVSTTTLAVAVAVSIVVLLLAFGGIIWFGIQRGWFVKKTAARDGSTVDKNGVATTQHDGSDKPTGGNGEVRELHADHRPHQLDYSPVHELQGSGEDGRGHVVRN